jgi:DNA adenine methylase
MEPFCGSCVAAFNLCPERAILADTNQHIIQFYQAIQAGDLNPESVTCHLQQAGAELFNQGEAYYYEVRRRFNDRPNPLDFLFLNRACFNGLLRFNRRGQFNVPFCRKPQRFAAAYITKIANQVKTVAGILQGRDWQFKVADFGTTLTSAEAGDIVYADPPYLGRHTDYFNSWTIADEIALIDQLKQLPCQFLLSTWQYNQFRHNPLIKTYWQSQEIEILSIKHFYHVGAVETNRHPMMEAMITNRRSLRPTTQTINNDPDIFFEGAGQVAEAIAFGEQV